MPGVDRVLNEYLCNKGHLTTFNVRLALSELPVCVRISPVSDAAQYGWLVGAERYLKFDFINYLWN